MCLYGYILTSSLLQAWASVCTACWYNDKFRWKLREFLCVNAIAYLTAKANRYQYIGAAAFKHCHPVRVCAFVLIFCSLTRSMRASEFSQSMLFDYFDRHSNAYQIVYLCRGFPANLVFSCPICLYTSTQLRVLFGLYEISLLTNFCAYKCAIICHSGDIMTKFKIDLLFLYVWEARAGTSPAIVSYLFESVEDACTYGSLLECPFLVFFFSRSKSNVWLHWPKATANHDGFGQFTKKSTAALTDHLLNLQQRHSIFNRCFDWGWINFSLLTEPH